MLETKITIDPPLDFFCNKKIQIFYDEGSSNNFDCASGGSILLKWIVASISFNLLGKSLQYLLGLVTYVTSSFLLTCVYAYNEVQNRIHLWNSLHNLHVSIDLPSIVLWDFNVIMFSKDKDDGTPLSPNKLVDFCDSVFDSGLFDLSSIGFHYIYSNF